MVTPTQTTPVFDAPGRGRIYDSIVETIDTARKLARMEGIPCGISSGAALAATFKSVRRGDLTGKMIVTMIPSIAERYLSTILFEGVG